MGGRGGSPETQGYHSRRGPFTSEPKVPYVRLERLKICAASSGEMPVFKLKPQKDNQDGRLLLIIECGAESSSMSIQVPFPCLCLEPWPSLRASLSSLLPAELWLWPCSGLQSLSPAVPCCQGP